MEAGADVNAKDDNGKTALMYASEGGDLEAVRVLLEAGADIIVENSNALMSASERGKPDIVKLLLKAGANICTKDLSKALASAVHYPRHLLAMHGLNNMFKKLSNLFHDTDHEIHDIDYKDKNAVLAALASKYSTSEIVRILLEAGADVNFKGYSGQTALMSAPTPEIARILLEAGADVNAKDDNGKTALMCASGYDSNLEIVKMLLEAGADVNTKCNGGTDDGMTALLYASEFKNFEIVKILLESGADLHAMDKDSTTALFFALIDCRDNFKTAKILLEAGADANARYHNSYNIGFLTPLMYVSKYARYYSERNTNFEDFVKALLKAGADVNAKNDDDYGSTALMYASDLSGDLGMVKMLLEGGADVNVKDKNGKTAFDYALYALNKDIEELLLKYMPNADGIENQLKTLFID